MQQGVGVWRLEALDQDPLTLLLGSQRLRHLGANRRVVIVKAARGETLRLRAEQCQPRVRPQRVGQKLQLLERYILHQLHGRSFLGIGRAVRDRFEKLVGLRRRGLRRRLKSGRVGFGQGTWNPFHAKIIDFSRLFFV